MPEPPPAVRRGLRRTGVRAGAVARAAIAAIRATRAILRTLLEILLALVIIFEEWGWRPLAAGLAALARLEPVARVERAVAGLPPYPALVVFLLPSVLVLPLKLLSLWLIGAGHVLWAGLLFAFAKVAGTALVARIFQLTQPTLMQLGWFARLYGIVVPWKDALVARVKTTRVWQAAAAAKAWLKLRLHAAWAGLRPRLAAYLARLKAVLRGRRGA